MNESTAQNNDFSKNARMKKFIRANKKNFIALTICFVALVILFAIIIISAATDSDDYLTYENFEKIEIGMTYEEVVELLDNHVGRSPEKGSRVYTWKDASGTRSISVAVDKYGIVQEKSQSGLD